MKNLNIKKYSSIEIGSLRLPICISIEKIMDDDYYEIQDIDVEKREVVEIDGKDILIRDETPDFFYGKFKDIIRIANVLKIIYSFIDNENLRLLGIKSLIFTESEFIDFCINTSGVSQKNILDTFYIILSIAKEIKEEFRKNAIDMVCLLKEFPDIPKNKDDEKYAIPKKYVEFLSYPYEMIHLKSCIEYSGDIIFKENIGKSFDEFSWREKEIRKIYDTMKSKIDGFTESVKSFVQKNALNT